ncbi:hypothetical protein C8J57DRAFT_1650756 [Mycena rebaudengoi]|nr:hypothetical protein C8J57DRAFT_1650756 [Mycena rebaudengoi]
MVTGHIENAQISTNKRGNLFSRHMSSSRLKNELKNRLKTILHGGQLAPPTLRENTVEILSVSLRASAAICEAPPLNFLKPIVGLAALICETAKTAKSNRDAAEELAKHAINVTNCVVERAWKNGTVSETYEDALNILKGILEDVHSYLIFLNKRRRAMSWMLATQEKDRVAQLNAGLDRVLSLFMTTCVLSSNECLRSSNELVRSNTIQLDLLASTVKQLDGEMSQNVATHGENNYELDDGVDAFQQQVDDVIAAGVTDGTSTQAQDQPEQAGTASTAVEVGWFGEGSLGCCVPTLKPPDGVALAEAYTRLENESDGADGKEALERFVETRTALVAEAERVRRHSTCPTARRGLRQLIYPIGVVLACSLARSFIHSPLVLLIIHSPLTLHITHSPLLARSLTLPTASPSASSLPTTRARTSPRARTASWTARTSTRSRTSPRSVRFFSPSFLSFFFTSSLFAFSVKIRSTRHPRRSLAAPPPARPPFPSFPPTALHPTLAYFSLPLPSLPPPILAPCPRRAYPRALFVACPSAACSWGVLYSYRTHSSTPALPPLSPPPYPPRPHPPPPLPHAYPTPTGYNKALPHLLPILHAAHSARLVRGRAGRRGTRCRRGADAPEGYVQHRPNIE